jgi:serine/threonine protein kinase/Tol biopolymer transport system component
MAEDQSLSLLGRQIGCLKILSLLGAGGMGEVYRAEDTNLVREVAIKVLPKSFAQDPERLARFRREAQLLASLDHRNIAAIHGLEECGGLHYIVMELVPGQTLAERLASGPLHVEESLNICLQIAEALEAAHQKGVIHRDIKPANIKVTPEGVVKVLDFGLAKAFVGDGSSPDLSASSLVTATGTREGVIIGTPAYMSPEQARGKTVDKRTDVWAFGCALYELLTGRRAFQGETFSDTITKILGEAPDWQALPETTPPGIRRLLRRCLEKDPRQRLHDIGDARIEIEEVIASPTPTSADKITTLTTLRRHPLRLSIAALMVGAVALSLIVWKTRFTSLPSHGPVMRFAVTLPPTEQLAETDFPSVALSPTGAHLAYVASRGGSSQVFLRRMDSLQAEPIPGTEQALGPFFSPDGQWVGFFAAGKLMKVSVNGGSPVFVCNAPIGFGAVWGPDDTITFAPTGASGLVRVSAAGGTPSPATKLDSEKGEFSHRWPDLLPDGKTVLFTIGTLGSWDDAHIVAQSLETGERRPLITGGTSPHYVPTGHVIYMRGGTLMAVPFDLGQRKVTGPPFAVLPRVWESLDGAAQLSVSPLGHLVYAPGGLPSSEHTLVWANRNGGIEPLAAPSRAYSDPRLSPDGRRLAVTITDTSENIWVYDIPTGTFTQLTFEGNNSMPVWTPDGARITFASNRTGPLNLFWKRTDGGGTDERLTTSPQPDAAHSWSPDGHRLVFVEHSPTTGRDIWMLSTDGDLKPRPVIQSPSNEAGPALSPDGRWLAYVSDESGRNEIYVTPFPSALGKWQVSTEGGTEPLWSRDGSEIFYRIGNRVMTARTTTTPSFKTNTPQLLFEGVYDKGKASRPAYDVTADGRRFLMVKTGDNESAPTRFEVVLGWFEELKRRVPK